MVLLPSAAAVGGVVALPLARARCSHCITRGASVVMRMMMMGWGQTRVGGLCVGRFFNFFRLLALLVTSVVVTEKRCQFFRMRVLGEKREKL